MAARRPASPAGVAAPCGRWRSGPCPGVPPGALAIGVTLAAYPDFPQIGLPAMPLHPNQSALGPEPGQPFPDIILPDQHGTAIDLHTDRAGRPALVVFHRSARW